MQHVLREGNKVADRLAQGHSLGFWVFHFDSIPSCIVDVL